MRGSGYSRGSKPTRRTVQLAKPNYDFAKRQRELAKKQKQEAKRNKKQAAKDQTVGGSPPGATPDPAESK